MWVRGSSGRHFREPADAVAGLNPELPKSPSCTPARASLIPLFLLDSLGPIRPRSPKFGLGVPRPGPRDLTVATAAATAAAAALLFPDTSTTGAQKPAQVRRCGWPEYCQGLFWGMVLFWVEDTPFRRSLATGGGQVFEKWAPFWRPRPSFPVGYVSGFLGGTNPREVSGRWWPVPWRPGPAATSNMAPAERSHGSQPLPTEAVPPASKMAARVLRGKRPSRLRFPGSVFGVHCRLFKGEHLLDFHVFCLKRHFRFNCQAW